METRIQSLVNARGPGLNRKTRTHTVAMHRFNTNVVSGFSNISDPVEHLSQPGIDTREVGIGTFISETHNSNLCVPVNWTLKSKPINNQ